MTEYPIARNLDGIYYHVMRNGEMVKVCYSDLTVEERDRCTESYTIPQMRLLANMLANALRQLGDALNIVASFEGD